MLATLDCRCAPTSAKVHTYDLAFAALRLKCREPRRKLAEEAWNAKEILRKDGYPSVNGLGMLRLTNKSIPKATGRTSCGGIMAAIVVLIEHG